MNLSYVFVAVTIVLGVYGQLIIKWKVTKLGELPSGFVDRISEILAFVFDPWVFSALLGAVIAAAAWFAALSRLELSQAYPFVSASFVLVLIMSAIVFGESITAPKAIGAVLIVIGLVIGSQG
jgi:drug/metabolite transporter (DMT)-like permease